MTDIKVKPKRWPTLSNCDRCGRFTSNPDVQSDCIGGNNLDWHACWELLLCPKCSKGATNDQT